MTITDGDVAALATQVAELFPTAVQARVVPASGDDPYRWGSHRWVVRFETVDGRRPAGVAYLTDDLTPAQALATVIDTLANDASETEALWGQPFPPCPGHRHGLAVQADGEEVALSCPASQEVVQRIRPAGT